MLLWKGRYRIDCKDLWSIFWTFCTGNKMTRGFTKGVSVDVLYLKINDFLTLRSTRVQQMKNGNTIWSRQLL